jgi:hypothetical protein
MPGCDVAVQGAPDVLSGSCLYGCVVFAKSVCGRLRSSCDRVHKYMGLRRGENHCISNLTVSRTKNRTRIRVTVVPLQHCLCVPVLCGYIWSSATRSSQFLCLRTQNHNSKVTQLAAPDSDCSLNITLAPLQAQNWQSLHLECAWRLQPLQPLRPTLGPSAGAASAKASDVYEVQPDSGMCSSLLQEIELAWRIMDLVKATWRWPPAIVSFILALRADGETSVRKWKA